METTIEKDKLNAYRQLGLDRLEQLLLQLPAEPHEADYFVDRAIRQLSNLPPAKEGAPPYHGIYSDAFTFEQYRDGATDRLEDLMMALPELDELDGEVDNWIRQLSDLPLRAAVSAPYTRLFILREEAPPEPNMMIAPATYGAPAQTYVTLEQMLDIVGSKQHKDRIQAMMPGINETCHRFQINTPLRISHFFGQILHESGGFRWLREIWGPTDAQRRYEPQSRLARNLGNVSSGDGRRYMGRGVIQLTGRYNYKQFSDAMGMDFVSNPDLVASPQYAVLVGGWYWDTRKINGAADRDDLLRVTRLVNGGKNGLADRRRYLDRSKRVLGA
ncbi:MAG: glycoside hydrolase family 19 protein [Cyanobacteria bacterium J06638_20]